MYPLICKTGICFSRVFLHVYDWYSFKYIFEQLADDTLLFANVNDSHLAEIVLHSVKKTTFLYVGI